MKFGMGSNMEQTQKYARSKYKMTYVRPHIFIARYPSDRACRRVLLVVCLSTNGKRAYNYTIVI